MRKPTTATTTKAPSTAPRITAQYPMGPSSSLDVTVGGPPLGSSSLPRFDVVLTEERGAVVTEGRGAVAGARWVLAVLVGGSVGEDSSIVAGLAGVAS